MNTGSLRLRVTLTTFTVLGIVLAGIVIAVTLAYRAKLEGDLRHRLATAGAAVQRAGGGSQLKALVPGLALEGISIRGDPAAARRLARSGAPATGRSKVGSTIRTRGSLLVLDETLRGGMVLSLTASRASIDHAVTSLLLVVAVVTAVGLALATFLVLQGTRTALRPLFAVIDAATRIASGDSKLRLSPSRSDTELGRLAAAFDQMVAALDAAVDEARASDAATRRFLADASHELRTPITNLQVSIETLLREQPERPERDRLEAAAARDSQRLGRLVNDLLGLARLEAHPTRVPIDLGPVAGQLVQGARARAPHATITLHTDDDTIVYGNPEALERTLQNLIDNALAAIGPTGQIEVQLRRHNGSVHALVTDDGPGVPAHQRERIFERFARLDPTKPGHGLGLAIARRIARQHNGDLTCDPSPDGASFTLRLPTDP
ncbi:MAG TPA: HAMP domain-containing sensor histidine kinase [Solirubrobacteraceae bacterium]|jgi:signal transduction histidine kinase